MRKIWIALSLGSLLAGCSSPVTRNPAKELCSGTKRPYVISGINYTPQDHYDYDEEGIASWYGPGFHQRSTSCGSTYDMHAHTAAHKTLPIPSVVEVTNLENGKSLRLVVNDRGPFVNNRIIDLSKQAAQDLGSHGKGLARVRVRAIPEESVALANYLKQFGRYGLDPQGRSWDAIYKEEIVSRGYDLSPPPPPKYQETIQRSDRRQPSLNETVMRIENESAKPKFQRAVYSREDKQAFNDLVHKATAKASPRPQQQHYISVGSFIQKQNALKLKQELQEHGKIAITETTKQGQRFFAVKLGPYANQAQAKRVLSRVQDNGYYGVELVGH